MRLAVLGAGAVGRSVVDLAAEYGHVVTAVADSGSSVVDPDGLDAEAVLDRKERDGVVGDADPADVLTADYDVLVEATPTTLGDAEPGFSHVRTALEADRHVVLANKDRSPNGTATSERSNARATAASCSRRPSAARFPSSRRSTTRDRPTSAPFGAS